MPTRSNDQHENVDEISTAVLLECRSGVIGISPLREALRSQADLVIDTLRRAAESDACVRIESAETLESDTCHAGEGGSSLVGSERAQVVPDVHSLTRA